MTGKGKPTGSDDDGYGRLYMSPTHARAVEIANEIQRELDAMSPEERAAHLTKRRQALNIKDAERLAKMSPEEREWMLKMREGFHDRIRREARNPGSRPIKLPRTDPFFWRGAPQEAVAAEAALQAARDRVPRRRSKPRADGW